MSAAWISLAQLKRTDTSRVGNKAAALAILRRAGLPVPAGVCLTTDAFQQAIAPYRAAIEQCLQPFDLSLPGQAAAANACILDRLAGLEFPMDCEPGLRRAIRRFASGGGGLAVRSSALAEDSTRASFAGQFHTELGVRGLAGSQAAILAVWRSAFNPAVLAARAAASPALPEGMAVLLQPMLVPDCAGVCFSADPVSRRRDRLVINAVWGLGQGAVDGSVPADTVWLRRSDLGILDARIIEKPECLQLDPAGGVARVAVPEDKRTAACLPESWLRRIGQFCITAEACLGGPQDMEWAIQAGQLWILQSRPVTSLPGSSLEKISFPTQFEPGEDQRRFWTLSIPEGQPEAPPLLPLEIDYIAQLESTRLETCLWMGAERNQDMQVRYGRVYFSPAPLPLSPADIQVRRRAMQDLAKRLIQAGQTTWDTWGPEIERANQRLIDFPAAKTGPEHASHLAEALAARKRHNMLHPMIGLKPPASYFQVFERVSGQSGQQAEAAAYRCLLAEETPFTRLMDGLYRLAELARALPAVAALLPTPPANSLAILANLPEAAAFSGQLQAFLAEFGDRTGNGYGSEAGIATPTWREQPEQVLRLAAIYLDNRLESPRRQRERTRQAVDAEIAALCQSCPDQQAVEEFQSQLNYARRVAALVEIHNHAIEQVGLGQLRRALLAACNWLVENGAISASDDGLYLSFDEILAALSTDTPTSLAETIETRRKWVQEWRQLEPPPCLGIPPAHLPDRPALHNQLTPKSVNQEGLLQGIGASPGLARGRVRLIRELVPLPDVARGEILVAENAGPLWSPVFPILGGLILDSGSLGQHAATIAREYGIPAVIATGRATRWLESGDWVELDGASGAVKRIDQPV